MEYCLAAVCEDMPFEIFSTFSEGGKRACRFQRHIHYIDFYNWIKTAANNCLFP